MKVVHAVVTEAFAGTERYVADVATEQARQGLNVTVIGGQPLRNQLPPAVTWLPGGTPFMALRTAWRLGHQDIAHAHLTYGETVLTATRSRHHGACLATRHLATPRGRSSTGRLARALIERRLQTELAISQFVSDATSGGTIRVLHNGVPAAPLSLSREARSVVMAHRLEPEKRTELGLQVWFASGLAERGFSLLVAGDGSERPRLEALAAAHPWAASVTFTGRVDDMPGLWRRAAVLLAPAEAEPLGLSVLEGMAHGIPVVASAAGGHLESLAGFPACLFPGDDPEAGGQLLDGLADADVRASVGAALQHAQQDRFSLDGHVRQLTKVYRRLVDS